LGLHDRPPGEIAAAESGGKSQIVFDARAHSGLSARGLPLDHDGVETFGGPVNRGRQTGRSATDNCQVIKAGLGACAQPYLLRNLGRHALQKLGPVGKQYDRKIGRLGPKRLEETFGLRIAGGKLNVDPLIGDVIARQEIP